MQRNLELLSTLVEDAHSSELLALTAGDAKLNRMTDPVSIDRVDLEKVNLATRSGVVQGVREDGSDKIRACDNETQSGTKCVLPADGEAPQ